MTAPTLIVDRRAATRDYDRVIYAPAQERAWVSLGDALLEMYVEQDVARRRLGASPQERDAAGFAARGLELAVEVWNDVTTVHRGTSLAWEQFARLVAADLSGGYTEAVRSGLLLALTRMESVRAEYHARSGN